MVFWTSELHSSQLCQSTIVVGYSQLGNWSCIHTKPQHNGLWDDVRLYLYQSWYLLFSEHYLTVWQQQ